jgi:hypothetical protein
MLLLAIFLLVQAFPGVRQDPIPDLSHIVNDTAAIKDNEKGSDGNALHIVNRHQTTAVWL